MRSFYFSLVFITCLISSSVSNAQLGWQWAVGSTHPTGTAPIYAGFDAQPGTMDAFGNIFVSGYGWGDSAVFGPFTLYNKTASRPLVIIKTDSTGVFQWVVATSHADVNGIGLATDPAGNLYVYGEYDSATCTIGSVTLNNPGLNYMSFLAKFSPGGTLLWAENISPGAGLYTAAGVETDAFGNVIIIGSFDAAGITLGTTTLTSAGYGDMFVAKFDSMGNNIWAKGFGGTAFDRAFTLTVLNNGDFYLAGDFSSPSVTLGSTTLTNTYSPMGFCAFISKLDSSGNVLWAKTMGKNISTYKMVHDNADNAYLAGSVDTSIIWGSDTLVSAGKYDAVLAKYNSSGNFQWARSGGGPARDEGFTLTIDKCGKIWMAGSMGNGSTPLGYSMNFGTHNLPTATGSVDAMFMAEYDTSGNYQTSVAVVTGGGNFSAVMADNKGNLLLTADYIGTVTLGTSTLPGGVLENLLIAKYKYTTSVSCPSTTDVQSELEKSAEIMLFPNPASYECNIHSDRSIPSGSTAALYNMTGRIVRTYQLSGNDNVISVSGIAPGIYQCRIVIEGRYVVMKKFIVMK